MNVVATLPEIPPMAPPDAENGRTLGCRRRHGSSNMAGVILAAIRALQEQNLALQARGAAFEEKLAGLN